MKSLVDRKFSFRNRVVTSIPNILNIQSFLIILLLRNCQIFTLSLISGSFGFLKPSEMEHFEMGQINKEI